MDQKNLANQAYTILDELFTRAEFMPGDKLSENQLCKQLNMSRTPIRSALFRLSRKGYIESIDKKGIYVKGFEGKEFEDGFELLIQLESIVYKNIDKIKDVETLYTNLQQCLDLQKAAKEQNDYLEYLTHQFTYSEILFNAYDNSALIKAYHMLKKDMIRMGMIIYKKTMHYPHYSSLENKEKTFSLLKEGKIKEILELNELFYQNVNNSYSQVFHSLSLKGEGI